MKPRINTITLAVQDLERSLRFYRVGLGFETEGIIGSEFPGTVDLPDGRVAMFQLENGVILAIYPATELAKDAGLEPKTTAAPGFSIGHIVETRSEVDALLMQAQAAGGRLVGAIGERPWGIYSGYFLDPDENLWEIVNFLS